jgi:DNA-binding GntR family transcriptional regulator
LAEQAYEIIKGRILDRDLPPGARLNIDALVRDLGVSSSPLQEALAKLQAERLVVFELYSGYSVAPEPSLSYLRDLVDCRILQEGRGTGSIRRPRLSASGKSVLRKVETKAATRPHCRSTIQIGSG